MALYDGYLEAKPGSYDKLLLEIAHDLLVQESNLVTRVPQKFKDSDKAVRILKEVLFYTTAFYEKYKITGGKGGKGGDKGVHMFNHEVLRAENPGKGGKSAFELEGTYLNEYSFAALRNIKEKNKAQPKNENLSALSAFLKTVGLIGTGGAIKIAENLVRPIIGAGYGIILYALGILATPIVAHYSSKWIHGPFEVVREDGIDGDTREITKAQKELQKQLKKEWETFLKQSSDFTDVIYPKQS